VAVKGDPLPSWLALAVALAILLGLTAYPPLLVRPDGRVDHALLLALCWAMSAGFVRGVGFEPRQSALRLALSGRAVTAALLLAAVVWGLHR
jgi:predicted membrane protein